MMRAVLVALLLAIAGAAFAQSSEVAKPDPAVERRMKALAEELRCLVCQNQTIADSNAPLALDLRNQIRAQIAEGRTDTQIREYMTDRYGDFVLYRPPFKATTAILWVGPFAMVALGVVVFLLVVRRRRAEPAAASVPQQRRAELEALLDESGRAEVARPKTD
jgi:cytochrome c-type biogenesis protein CcmH